MGWERRGDNGPYYYRKRREGRRVVSEYIGTGLLAEAAATLDALGQERRELERLERQAERRELEKDRALAREVDDVIDMVRALKSVTLLLAGYHTHKGQWRRKRAR